MLKHVRSVCVFAPLALLALAGCTECGGKGIVSTESVMSTTRMLADGGEATMVNRVTTNRCIVEGMKL